MQMENTLRRRVAKAYVQEIFKNMAYTAQVCEK